ncbi:MAG: hypothetical protein HQM16_05805 [Deltaproteobacteria bacterium]|nr:hypothetical protein [Deltaproteobacteria bacterium]
MRNVGFNADDLKKIISSSIEKTQKETRWSYTINNNCMIVKFEDNFINLPKILSNYNNAPSIKSGSDNFEYGLGPYYVQSATQDEILLRRKNKTKNGYDAVRFIKYKGYDELKLYNQNIEDFNRVYVTSVPDWVVKEYKPYPVQLFQTINLIINLPDKTTRSIFYNCMDIHSVRSALMPEQKEFLDISNFLPIGMPGGSHGRASQNCMLDNTGPQKNHGRIIFANYRKEASKNLKDLLDVFSKKTGIEIAFKDISESELIETFSDVPHPYDVYIIALDATDSTPLPFIEPFFTDKRLIDFKLTDLESIYNNLSKVDDFDSTHFDEINKVVRYLQEEHFVLPLFQESRMFYYPAHVKGLKHTTDLLQYPEVGDLTL